MFVERVLSLNNGWSLLTTEKHSEWQDITDILALFSVESIKEYLDKTRSKNKDAVTIHFDIYYNGYITKAEGWTGTLPRYDEKTPSIAEDRLIKNGVSTCFASSLDVPSGNFSNNLYLVMPYYHSLGQLEVFVVLAPTVEAKAHLLAHNITQIHSLLNEKDCRAELARFGPSASQLPIVLAFFSPTAPEEVAIEEIIPLKVGEHTIERTLEFAPEYYQASVGLLSYFGSILRQKDPNTKSKVRIEQDGNTVRLHIVPPIGEAEVVERQLEQFALIVNGEASPESLLDDPGQIIQLKTQLRMAQMQVETAHDLRQLSDGRITSLEKQVEFLQSQFAAQILQNNRATDLNHKVIDLATQQANSHERMQSALLAHSGMLFKDLLEESRNNFQLLTAIQDLHRNLLSGLTTVDIEEQIKQSLDTVKQQKPGMLARIYTQVEGAALKAGAGATLGWAVEVVKHAIEKP
jgi:hypothetical protein